MGKLILLEEIVCRKTAGELDNSAAEGVINSRVQPKRTKSMDMRFEWLLDCEQPGPLIFVGSPGRQI